VRLVDRGRRILNGKAGDCRISMLESRVMDATTLRGGDSPQVVEALPRSLSRQPQREVRGLARPAEYNAPCDATSDLKIRVYNAY
jgi:hypothetical protein